MQIDDLIDDFIKETKTKVKRIEQKLYTAVLEHYSDNLDITDGRIRLDGNIKTIESLWKAISTKLEKDIALLGKFVIDAIDDLFDVTLDDVKTMDVRALEIGDAVKKQVMDHAKKSITAQTDLSGVYSQIKSKSVSLMSKYDGISLKELRETLQKSIVIDGMIDRYWSRWTGDIYNQYQRAGGNEIRKELGLKYAMYEGGLIETSRKFCEDKNGEVFTEQEIQAWADEDWPGKNEGYVPELDCGGYNCRHRLRWISKELAEELRPELKDGN